tara:strand:- start:9989 stop:10897 length:909 start_codon:yes stop_codon:yes gene_type:complete
MSKYLITGANGFLGSNLVKYFVGKGHQVTAVIRSRGNQDKLISHMCNIVEYDGTIESLKEVINKQTIVIHTAAYYTAEHKPDDIDTLVNSNIQYGLNLLEAMRLSGANQIVNIGTAWQGFKGETRRPVNLYAATKQAFEDLIAYYCDAENFSSISLRLNDTYGELDQRMKLIKLLITSGVENKPIDMSAGDQKINLTHIDDVCSAIDQAISKLPVSGTLKRYNLINKDQHSLKDLVKLIETELNIIIPINWGAKNYRSREVMEPLASNAFPNWLAEKELVSGIRSIHNSVSDERKNKDRFNE